MEAGGAVETERVIPMTEPELRAEIERQLAAAGSSYRIEPSIADRIRAAIAEHVRDTGRPMRAVEIVQRTGAKASTVSVVLMRLRQAGEIVGGGAMGYVPKVVA
jgi:tRNA A37 N6-isopentenylltransferase MiaA